ncbi:MAG: DCL family protein [Pseudonocardia sp.]|nr:DCL family protein [Pseudonocardia sp.]
MAKYQLGSHTYPSKSVALAEFRSILNGTALDEPLSASAAGMIQLLLRDGYHPEAAEKIGPGIEGVVVRINAYGTRGFWLRRLDGTEVDFSYLVALNGAPSVEQGVRIALREEINDQIVTFFDTQTADLARGRVVCELCVTVVGSNGIQVDHAAPTFIELASRFADSLGGWDVIGVECVGPTGRRLADRNHARVWWEFHRQTARLRLVHKRCNLSRARSAHS